jgi:pimeloyl-ACP methyl ester carboxylesterase
MQLLIALNLLIKGYNCNLITISLNKNIYILSGLGADERVFKRLNFEGFSVTFIQWIVPNINDSIEEYASQICKQISTPKPILIGLSFGGIMAIEIAKQIETEKVILLASVKSKNEIPYYYRWAGFIRLHKLIPARFLVHSNPITNWLFGTATAVEKKLFRQMLLDTPPQFLLWATDRVARWKNTLIPKNIFHIHGSKDHILPLRYLKCNHIIKDGGHLMTLNKYKELNQIIKEQLKAQN